MNEDYFLNVKGQQEGPFTLKELQERWRTRRGINGDTLFWQQGMDEWIPLSTISDLLQTQSYNPHIAAGRMSAPRESDKRILPAFILWFFLGGFGAHRFYIGRPVSGFILPILTIIGLIGTFSGAEVLALIGGLCLLVTGVWLVIDLICIVVGSMTDGDDRAIKKWT